MSRLIIRKVAVLGAGVMGAQIAAHCANADVPVILFDLPAREGDANGIVGKALDAMKKLDPAPFAARDRVRHVEAANYAGDLARLGECDLIIEAIAEKIEWKLDLYAKVAPHLKPGAVFASNTSGLSINALSAGMPAAARSRFCGIHFFNPPRYMPLVELIPTADTDPATLDVLEAWLTTRLGKSIIRAKDTPNFVANRVGVFSILAVLHHTARLGLAFDEVDLLTGPRIGRPKSATFRTADVVGLDTLAHVVGTMQATLPNDPWHAYFKPPEWLQALIGKGALGQKTRCGIYRKQGRQIQVLDLGLQDYRDSGGEVFPDVEDILKLKNPADRFAQLAAHPHPQAQFLWSIFRDVFHYCAVHLGDIADNARDVDLAMRWGFGWAQGPFETWQAAGWREVAEMVQDDIRHGRAMSSVPLPPWVFEREGVHAPAGSFSAEDDALKPRSALPVYRRQLYPDRVFGEAPDERGDTLWENGGVRLWRRADQDARIGIVSITSKMHAIGDEVMDGMLEAIARAEVDLDGLVIWHPAPFAVGANLQQVGEACRAGQFELLDDMVAKFQRSSMAIKHAQVPVVAAVQGMALGGGCEFAMHAAHRVMALESYVGLVEAGVGLIPAGGGSKEFALQAHAMAQRTAGGDVFPFIQTAFQTIAMATVAKSAIEAVQLGFARVSDDILFNANELLYAAIRRARGMAESAWRPVLTDPAVVVAGRDGIATCELMLVNMAEGGFISAHDYRVAKAAATALCGGEVDSGSRVGEQWILDVERAQFVELLKTEKTQQRIAHMLETGKPLRN
ncbi:3-hydroxyacyl-CoA dehydrogenase/enoyl-CoA hydratase family protein [Thauera linaloolentis]|uniref:3-hydroxyacyl-CoA dehydrogenase n=1 Tax=Thauera linaloolentis (strain DSM 12138 / JCM 21573 / CCUG 41526 / CIP 105981 / IAM 15112 / NBRC 102519 / 47Lol) TaxID=1123367 RepID=N6YDS8_THAL4|nr:3-hydroxyacyl-CoA dehydrogenase/enoyl-CoA hydratase family protein [Thauera linaloolentis]ENO89695.1 3-hydroxyacyl-CoA dehydrogenase [Thauera linaloolentis 47Lol = DSM 12138]MCM8567175.1 3-hydroxyacyl-CoA dehydrogenase/enoyl-CoA hydratase family protein [Thauera linaloolentis]